MKFYSIHDIVKVKTNINIEMIPDYFLVDDVRKDFAPDIEVIQENLKSSRHIEGRTRCGVFFYWKDGSALHIDYNVPFFKVKLIIDDLPGQTRIRFTKAFRKFGNINLLCKIVLLLKFIQKGYALIHSGSLSYLGRKCILFPAMRDTGKTSTILSLLDGKKFKFMSDDLTIISKNGDVYSYPKDVGISPYTLTGKMISHSSKVKIKLAKSPVVTFLLGRFNKDLCERVSIPTGLIEDRGSIEKVFILTGGGREDIREIDSHTATRKILATTAELLDPFRVYSLNFYSYIFDFDILELFNKEKEIIEEALNDAECFELRANDVKKYPEMIRKILGETCL